MAPEIITLPPQSSPRALTADAKLRSLEDMLGAFLCANNQNGFSMTKVCKESISDIVFDMAHRNQVTVDTLKRQAREIKVLSDGALCHGQALNILARSMGYVDFPDALRSRAAGSWIKSKS